MITKEKFYNGGAFMKRIILILVISLTSTGVFADCNNMFHESNFDPFSNFLIDTPEECGWEKTAFDYSDEYINIKRVKNPVSHVIGGEYIYYDAAAFSETDKKDTLIEIWISPDKKDLVGFATMIGNARPFAFFHKSVTGDTIQGYSDHNKNGIYDYKFSLSMKDNQPIPIQGVWEVRNALTRGKFDYTEYKKKHGEAK